MELEFSRQIFEKKSSNIKFHQNPSGGSRVVYNVTYVRHSIKNQTLVLYGASLMVYCLVSTIRYLWPHGQAACRSKLDSVRTVLAG